MANRGQSSRPRNGINGAAPAQAPRPVARTQNRRPCEPRNAIEWHSKKGGKLTMAGKGARTLGMAGKRRTRQGDGIRTERMLAWTRTERQCSTTPGSEAPARRDGERGKGKGEPDFATTSLA
jgi:hypothetical protein